MSAIEQILLKAQTPFDRINKEHQLVRWAEESQFARQAVVSSSRLMGCIPETIEDAIINVAATGLTLNPAYGYAYLIPEYDKDRNTTVCQLRISFKGLIKVANDSGSIRWIAADVVKQGDVFRFNGKWEKPDHNIDNPFSDDDRGKSVGVYCVACMDDGSVLTEIAPWSQVQKARAAAKFDGVWNEWEDEMAKKFIIKRASKQWPKTPQSERLAKTVSVINDYEGSDSLTDKMDQTAAYILSALQEEEGPDIHAIGEAWDELTDDEKTVLNTAYTKGGYFQQAEKKEIRQAIYEYNLEKRQIEDQNPESAATIAME